MIEANNPNRKSFVDIEPNSDFPIQNLPFGAFSHKDNSRCGVALGKYIIDLNELQKAGLLENLPEGIFNKETLNDFVALGKETTRNVRNRIAELFDVINQELQKNNALLVRVLILQSEVTMLMPVKIGDYTDFYSSREHATNVGTMFRDPNNALFPNWLHLPVGYHGRASSIITSGQEIYRPKGQQRPNPEEPPVYGPCRLLDFELEMGFITHQGKDMGDTISIDEAEDYIFGMVVFNDWSARDIQKWEYIPLGPFLAKNFASCISPWIVTLDALEPYRCESPEQVHEPLPYLKPKSNKASFDINLEAIIKPENKTESRVSLSNFKYMYWSMAQQLAHHTVNGCNVNVGDMMASGTISGPTKDSYGSMLELSWQGKNPVLLNDGEERKFIKDYDTVIMRAHCDNGEVRIGFGEVSTKVLPAK